MIAVSDIILPGVMDYGKAIFLCQKLRQIITDTDDRHGCITRNGIRIPFL